MNTRITTIVSAATLALVAASAHAAITSTSGGALQIAPPPVCVPGGLTGLTAFAWDEQASVPFVGVADMINNPTSIGGAIAGPVSGVYDSHFIHFEGVPGVIGVGGTVTFNNPIVAVMFNQTNIDNSDVLGAFGTIYPTGFPLRGVSAASFFSIAGNTLTFQLTSTSFTSDIEQIRVLTQVPAPGACGLLAATGLLAARRRR